MTDDIAGLDELDSAAIGARLDGVDRVLAGDAARIRRGLGYLDDERPTTAAHVLAIAVRRMSMFLGPQEAVGRLLAAADEAGIEREQALASALVGCLNATTPKL